MDTKMFSSILMWSCIIVIYFAPAIASLKKEHHGAITTVNFFFGWTLIGWIACLVWAMTDKKKGSTVELSKEAYEQLLIKQGGK